MHEKKFGECINKAFLLLGLFKDMIHSVRSDKSPPTALIQIELFWNCTADQQELFTAAS